MTKCAVCNKDASLNELEADHIVPFSFGGGYGNNNIRWMHRTCHRRQAKWYWRLWNWLKARR